MELWVFLIKPDRTIYYLSVQSMPFVRPNFAEMVQALDSSSSTTIPRGASTRDRCSPKQFSGLCRYPDHVVIDIRKGTAAIRGPATREEKAFWDQLIARKADFEQELRELEAELSDAADDHRAIIETEIERTKRVIQIIGMGKV